MDLTSPRQRRLLRIDGGINDDMNHVMPGSIDKIISGRGPQTADDGSSARAGNRSRNQVNKDLVNALNNRLYTAEDLFKACRTNLDNEQSEESIQE